ncbi:MAG: trypsin-like serine protease [Polyangiaceae bacterium]
MPTRTTSLTVPLFLLTPLFAVVACSGTAAEEITEREDAEIVGSAESPIIAGRPATDFPEATLLVLDAPGGLRACSATLVAPQVVLTAGHCVANVTAAQATFPYAQGAKRTATGWAVFDYVAKSNSVDPATHDVGLVYLDKPVNLAVYPALATTKPGDGQSVINVGRVKDGVLSTTELFAGKALPIKDGASIGFPKMLVADPILQPGDSGGGVVWAGANVRTLVGVNSGVGPVYQFIARIDPLVDGIADRVAEHGGFGTTGGKAKSSTGGSSADAGAPVDAGSSGGAGGGNGGGWGNGNGGGNGGWGKSDAGAGMGGPDVPVDSGLPTPGTNVPTEKESNDTFLSANKMPPVVKGALGSATDEDWFTWDLEAAPSVYRLKIVADADARILLWKRVGSHFGIVTPLSTVEFMNRASVRGTYLFAVYSPTGTPQNYTVTLER